MRSYLFVAFFFFAFPAYSAEEPDHAIHQELRAILATLQSSISDGKYDAMLPILSRDIRATPIDQEVLSSHADVSAYFKKWFGPGGYLKKLDMKLDADALTELSADKTWGLARGSGLERYTLADGRKYDIKTRWTATLVKDSDGKWRLQGHPPRHEFPGQPDPRASGVVDRKDGCRGRARRPDRGRRTRVCLRPAQEVTSLRVHPSAGPAARRCATGSSTPARRWAGRAAWPTRAGASTAPGDGDGGRGGSDS